MEITLNITEDSKVELVKDTCEAVQGENNVTILNINFPSTIKGYSIDNYAKQIEFGECKELGECVKFLDTLNGNTYKLCDTCTQFKRLMIQFTLKNLVDEAEPIIWKTIPFALEFCESINAENAKEVQASFLSLAKIEKAWADDLATTKNEWETFVKANAIYVISKVGDVPTANATSLGDVIFYLGANSTSPYTLTYGHYYRCNYVNGAYEWTDLTQDPSLEGVANGIREINNNQTMQLWVGTKEELENEVTQSNVIYIPEDIDTKESFDEVLSEMAEDDNYNLAYPLKTKNGVLRFGDVVIPQKKILFESDEGITSFAFENIPKKLEVTYSDNLNPADHIKKSIIISIDNGTPTTGNTYINDIWSFNPVHSSSNTIEYLNETYCQFCLRKSTKTLTIQGVNVYIYEAGFARENDDNFVMLKICEIIE